MLSPFNSQRMISPMAPGGAMDRREQLRQRRMPPAMPMPMPMPEGVPAQQQTLPTAMRQQQAALEAMRRQQAMPPPPLPVGGSLPPELLQKPAMAPPLPPGGPTNPMISLTPPSLPVEQGAQGPAQPGEAADRELQLELERRRREAATPRTPTGMPAGFPGNRFMGMWGR